MFGREFEGSSVVEFGGKPGQRYRLVLDVTAMGNLSAVDVEQATRHSLLRNFDCLWPAEELCYTWRFLSTETPPQKHRV